MAVIPLSTSTPSSFLSIERWWEAATTGVDGLSKRHEAIVAFAAANSSTRWRHRTSFWTNPPGPRAHPPQRGANLAARHLELERWILRRMLTGAPPLGLEKTSRSERTVAVTPGKVVYRTHLAEIIQYAAERLNGFDPNRW